MSAHSDARAVRLPIRARIAALLGIGLLAAFALGSQVAGAVSGNGGTSSATQSSSDSDSSSASSSPSDCTAAVVITSVSITLSAGEVVVSFQHTGQGCPNATAAAVHVHQNLVASPHAGSDANHQWNKDYLIGPDSDSSVRFPLLAAADGKCFVQVDVHAGSIRKGSFFPTATCESSVPPTSAPASSSAPESSSAPVSSSAPESSSVAASSASSSSGPSSPATVPAFNSSVAAIVVGDTSFPSQSGLASTGVRAGAPLALAVLLIAFGLLLNRAARRRH